MAEEKGEAPVASPAAAAAEIPPPPLPLPPYDDVNAKWDVCMDLSIRRIFYSTAVGAFAGLFLFRSPVTRWTSVGLATGIGIGTAFTECSYIFGRSPAKLTPKISKAPLSKDAEH
ncbi:unnamed protein product [Coffea canephora]|uniref:MICOS complex subunit MIC10 n=2 Tax=Coffea TaxID=13442 RepID=A0A068UR59_COFCA|nr:uncharacterized protein LOC113713289 [Coffea arabica]CDP10714.1 unnamed protein product [Coffea canephora]